jgi:hypothetical protein
MLLVIVPALQTMFLDRAAGAQTKTNAPPGVE